MISRVSGTLIRYRGVAFGRGRKGLVRSSNRQPLHSVPYRRSHSQQVEATSVQSGSTQPPSLSRKNDAQAPRSERPKLGRGPVWTKANFLLDNRNTLKPGSMSMKTWRHAKSVLDEMAKQHTPVAAEMSEKLLERLVEETTVTKNPKIKATDIMYNETMNAWAKSGAPDAPMRVETILRRMELRHEKSQLTAPQPNSFSFDLLLHAWAVSKDPCATAKAEELIGIMEQMSQANPGGPVHPTTLSYNLVILTYANRVGEYGAAKAAEDWLLRLSDLSTEGGPSPDSVTYNTVLKAWANSQDEKGPSRAYEVLKLMIGLWKDGYDVRPTSVSFLTVINSFAKRGQALKAQEILDEALDVATDLKDDLTPCLNATIHAWATSRSADAGERAEDLLKRAIALSKGDTDFHVTSNETTYTSCLNAYVRSNNPRALENADDFLWRMIGSRKSGKSNVSPNVATFTCIISAWAKSGREDAAEKAEKWLIVMIDLWKEGFPCHPDESVYTICIDAWASTNGSHAVKQAVRLLKKVEYLYDKGQQDMRPSHPFIYRFVIHRLLGEDDVHGALDILKRMEHQARSGNKDLLPDTHTCTKVIVRLVALKDERSIESALNLLTRMQRAYAEGDKLMQPDNLVFHRIMKGLLELPTKNSKLLALKIFDQMNELNNDRESAVQLDFESFKLASSALEGAGPGEWVAKKADDILLKLEKATERNLNNAGQDLKTCNVVLRVVSRSASRNKASIARRLLDRIGDHADIISYNTALNAAAFTDGDADEALRIVLETFQEVKASSRLKPDEITYSTVLRACRRLMPDEEAKRERMKSIFQEYCATGQSGKLPFEQMKKYFPIAEVVKLAASVSTAHPPTGDGGSP